MAFELPALPYDHKALDPFMSAQTLQFHHDKHHATYVTNLNHLTQATALANKSLEEMMQLTYNAMIQKKAVSLIMPLRFGTTPFSGTA